MRTALLLASLLFAPAFPPASAIAEAAQAEPQKPADPVAAEYDALVKEYAIARGEHAKRAQTAPGAVPHPAVAFFPRVEALAAKGEGRALLWMADRMQDAHPGRTKQENLEAAWKLLVRVAEEHADEPWIVYWSRGLTAQYVEFGAERVDPVVDGFVARCKDPEAVSEALYRAREAARRLKNEARAKALEARLVKDFPETRAGKRARGVEPASDAPFVPAIGKVAPDFTTEDADGVSFKLSDYRGKVVVLDFWGFW
jgi:hypothetical protein